MDLDSGDEAESQFFREQRQERQDCGFPSSVWGFRSEGGGGGGRQAAGRRAKGQDNHPRKRERRSTRRDGELEQRESKRRKRKSSSRDKENLVQKAEQKAPACLVEEDEDEDTMRAILLAQVSKAQTKKPGPAGDGDVQKAPSPAQQLLDKPPAVSGEPIAPALPAGPAPPVAKAAVKAVKVARVTRRTSNSKPPPTMSKADRERHFPNLSRKVVIPCIDANSDDSDDEDPSKAQHNGSSSAMFGLNLEAFLKEARNTVPTSTPNVQPKKLLMTPQLKAQALKLTLADKKRLISSKISHLSRSKQIEYQRLKEILAKKEAIKKKAAAVVEPKAPGPKAAGKAGGWCDGKEMQSVHGRSMLHV
jgi:hypothetical protein